MADQLNIFVSPYGKLHQVQAGIEVKPGRSLKEILTAADSSEQDLNPELCYGLRKALTYGR